MTVYPPTQRNKSASTSSTSTEENDLEHGRMREESDDAEDLTPLTTVMDDIGIGLYQKHLLVLCGFGWMADNMWLQCVSLILPRVQDEFGLLQRHVGILSSSTFAGMMLGAWAWGSFSDSYGRTPAFNGTLLLTAIFGLFAGYAPSFPTLCVLMFCLGVGIGGSMPTDGTLFLENIPKSKAYLLTGLSIFFSIGAVLSSVIAYIVLPEHSCRQSEICNPQNNTGWRSLLKWLGIITLAMLFARLLLFRLEESPQFLVSTGRADEAILVLHRICEYNGISDVPSAINYIKNEDSTVFEELGNENAGYTALPTDETRNVRRNRNRSSSELLTRKKKSEYLERLVELLDGKWRNITLLIWVIWAAVSAGFTIFNGFLPSYLEKKVVGSNPSLNTLEESLRDSIIYTASGLPGALVGAYLVEGSLGRRGSMFWATILTAVGALSFALVRSKFWIVSTTVLFSFSATIMWAIVYSWTPELFQIRIRGTACGIASALNRFAGIIAPLITGILLEVSIVAPLLVSTFTLISAAVCMVFLPETRMQ